MMRATKTKKQESVKNRDCLNPEGTQQAGGGMGVVERKREKKRIKF